MMSPEEKFTVINQLKDKIEDHFMALGQIFSEIKRSKAFRLKGYQTFKDFVETELKLNNGMASKLINIYELYVEELDVDEMEIKDIGIERLSMIKPIMAKATFEEQEIWMDKARTLASPELRDEIKEMRLKEKNKDKTMKDILAEQYLERMTTFFKCSAKELNFKLALYFQEYDLEAMRLTIKEKQRRFEEESQQGGV
jgi:hypothetical protein